MLKDITPMTAVALTHNRSTILLDDKKNEVIVNGVAKELSIKKLASGENPTKEGQLAISYSGEVVIAEKQPDTSLIWKDKSGSSSVLPSGGKNGDFLAWALNNAYAWKPAVGLIEDESFPLEKKTGDILLHRTNITNSQKAYICLKDADEV